MIVVKGAREHNLKGVDVKIPRGTFTTITGVSGSGKSSLAFDTIYREGQRRFLESLSSYARQFLGGIDRPKVEHVEGLSPAVSIDQKTVSRNPRSTVGTITEIYDYLRLLYARLGTPGCPQCGKPVRAQTPERIVERILHDCAGERAILLAPIVRDRKGEYRKELEGLLRDGFVRARIDGEIVQLAPGMRLERYKRHTIEAVMDRVVVKEAARGRITDGVERALEKGGGFLSVLVGSDVRAFSRYLHCVACGIDLPELEPRLFSFNSPRGACPDCAGLGRRRAVDVRKVVADPEKSIREGALGVMTKTRYLTYTGVRVDELADLVPVDEPWNRLTEGQQRLVLYSAPGARVRRSRKWSGTRGEVSMRDTVRYKGVLPAMEEAWRERRAKVVERFISELACDTCGGRRLRPAALAVKFHDRSIDQLAGLPVDDALAFFLDVELTGGDALVGQEILKELRARLGFLSEVGLGYLNLDRSAATLAGGEAQRIRLATQVGAGLKGVTYVLDEPSIGLHPRDNARLLRSLKRLRDAGNTVLVVEHDDETMRASDYLVDVGPGAGREGGEIVAEGYPAEVWRSQDSLTAAYLRGDRRIPVPETRREPKGELVVRGARHHNLQAIDVSFPLAVFTCVTGVSGSGKSSLLHDVLRRALAVELHGAQELPGDHDAVEGLDEVDKVIEIDQSPIGRTPRSNPATYTKLFDSVRDLYALVPEARVRGYKKGRFSFNVKGGRCETCKGAGVKTVEMQFLPDVEVICEDCNGHRFNDETLEIRFKDKSIAGVLAMTVEEACDFFKDHPRLSRVLETLRSVGLGYISLGQPATTLSGGEAQRVKIAKELGRPGTGRTLYLLDEPTTGLHHEDVRHLLGALDRFVEKGNTVIVIEHNLDVVKCADFVVDLGPEGGAGGGALVCTGTPEEVARHAGSHTGRALRAVLRPRARAAPRVKRRKQPRLRDLVVRGARLHNLKGVDVRVPATSITVVTGPSGSGKTSLAFDTIFAEGQRRYVESLSTYARRFLGRMDKPPVDTITGLGPAIAIDQRNRSRNPRSTVATTTEIHDYLRLLFARAGTPRCPECRKELRARAPSTEAARLARRYAGQRLLVLAPLAGEVDIPRLKRDGYTRLYVDGEQRPLGPVDGAAWLVVDRIQVKGKARLAEALEQAYAVGHGVAGVAEPTGAVKRFSERPACTDHDVVLRGEMLEPRMFSFNSHHGACPRCHGLGVIQRADPQKVIRYPELTFRGGAFGHGAASYLPQSKWYRAQVEAVAAVHELPLKTPLGQWGARELEILFDGTGEEVYQINRRMRRPGGRSYRLRTETTWAGVSAILEGWYKKSSGGRWTERITEVMQPETCPVCRGERLNPVSRATTLPGKVTLGRVSRMTVAEALGFFAELELSDIVDEVLHEIRERLRFLDAVGLGYLTLDRRTATLSGGEAQRIRLATQIGSGLVGVVYVLDEPTIGLHPRDTQRLLDSLRGLRDLGNTVLIVEHDPDTIRAADHVLDLGPGAGKNGGEVVFAGSLKQLARRRGVATADFLFGRRTIERPPPRPRPRAFVRIKGAHAHNLKHVDCRIPVGRLSCITGVSGAGKSSLLFDVLWAAADADGTAPGKVTGLDRFGTVYVVDQLPIGTTPASNPATYTKALDPIRKLFAQVPEARMRGYEPGRFSFNRAGGRCDACEGRGAVRVEMHFLADVWVPCDDCRTRRYNRETLEVKYKGKSIADVLAMEVSEARVFFANIPQVARILGTLDDVGLGYLSLGQPATTLSGGEAQRVKLAAELARRSRDEVLYLLDEPTCGLHPSDIEKLVQVLHRLVDQGHTVVVVEHNLDFIRTADWIVDLGPEGGDAGGELVVEGPPAAIAKARASHTGRVLRA
ncbi:MAG: excinuclease ABC subunit UvrA [Planctomycetota bacterium]|jgi:excinuclease ABC subunit A